MTFAAAVFLTATTFAAFAALMAPALAAVFVAATLRVVSEFLPTTTGFNQTHLQI